MPEISFPVKNKDSADTLFYLDPNPTGSPVVLLLHGLGAAGESWQLQLPSLVEAGFRPIALDMPGFGKSTCQNRWSISLVANRTTALVESLGLERVCVVGISMGGVVALQMVLDFPRVVNRLTLVNTFARLRSGYWREWLYYARRYVTLMTQGFSSQAELVAQRVFPGQGQEALRAAFVEMILQGNERVYKTALRSLGLFDVQKRLGEIHVPTLVISGENDTTVPLPVQHIMVERIHGARQIIISQAGHAVIVDQPEAFNQALLKFLHPTGRLNPEHL